MHLQCPKPPSGAGNFHRLAEPLTHLVIEHKVSAPFHLIFSKSNIYSNFIGNARELLHPGFGQQACFHHLDTMCFQISFNFPQRCNSWFYYLNAGHRPSLPLALWAQTVHPWLRHPLGPNFRCATAPFLAFSYSNIILRTSRFHIYPRSPLISAGARLQGQAAYAHWRQQACTAGNACKSFHPTIISSLLV